MIENFFTQDISLYKLTEAVSTDTGDTVKTYTLTKAVKGRIAPMTDSEVYRKHKMGEDARYKMYVPISTLFEASDKIVCGTSTYIMTGQRNPMNMDRFLVCELKVVS